MPRQWTRSSLLLALTVAALSGCCGPLLCGTCTADPAFGYRRCCFSCVEWPNSRACGRGADVGGYHGGDWYKPETARWRRTGPLGVSGELVAEANVGKHHATVCACPPKCTCWQGTFRGVDQPGRARWASGYDLRTD